MQQPSKWITGIMQDFTLRLADYIISEIQDIEHERPRRAKYGYKILPWGARFVDRQLFRVQGDFNQRPNAIGYVGRLAEGKGVLNLVEAIPLIASQDKDVQFVIVGAGPLSSEIEARARAFADRGRLEFGGFIPRSEVPQYLNRLKLLVLPSEEEGLPTIALEAMACGTPVLATPVGAVPEVIRHADTGFILESNSPAAIAAAVVAALQHPSLELVARRGRKLVEEKYSYQAALERYQRILEVITSNASP